MKNRLILFFIFSFALSAYCQDDLLSLLEEEEVTDYASYAFKTNKVVNLHSLENTAAGVFDFKISHRFGPLSGGVYELFGIDNSNIRFGGDFGLTDNFAVGIGRSSFEKTYDAYAKYRFLRQSTGKKIMPLTAAFIVTAAAKTQRTTNPNLDKLSSRMAFTYQLILGRKFSESFSLELAPTFIHRNIIELKTEKHDVFALGFGFRQKLNKRVSFNGEYVYVFPDQIQSQYENAISIGFDIETGGHVFQLHVTNATSMIEKGFITETTGSWNDLRFGFNISRVFTMFQPKTKK